MVHSALVKEVLVCVFPLKEKAYVLAHVCVFVYLFLQDYSRSCD